MAAEVSLCQEDECLIADRGGLLEGALGDAGNARLLGRKLIAIAEKSVEDIKVGNRFFQLIFNQRNLGHLLLFAKGR